MTLNDLLRKAQALAMQMSSGDVPIKVNWIPMDDVTFELVTDDYGEQFINIIFW